MTINPRFLRRSYVLATCLVVCCISTACGILPTGQPSGTITYSQLGAAGSSSLGAFQSGFYAFATASGSCVQCHGSTQAPLFAVSNPATACNNALPYLNLTNPASSPLVQYAGNGHCGISSVCGSNSSTVSNSIQSWVAAAAALGAGCASASSGGSGSGSSQGSGNCPAGMNPPSNVAYTTVALPIPSPLPSASPGAIMNFSLSNLTPANAAVAGSVFQVQVIVQNGGQPGATYRFIYPRMVVPTTATQVGNVHVLVDGCEDPSFTTWVYGDGNVGIFAQISPSKVPNPVSSTTPLTSTLLSNDGVEAPVIGPNDTVSLAFDTLTTSFNADASYAYLNTNLFTASCTSCHSGTTPPDGVNLSSYANVSAYINGAAGNGAELSAVLAPNGPMPENDPGSISPTLVQDLQAWINLGAPDN